VTTSGGVVLNRKGRGGSSNVETRDGNDSEESSEGDDDSDDPDSGRLKSVLFMQRREQLQQPPSLAVVGTGTAGPRSNPTPAGGTSASSQSVEREREKTAAIMETAKANTGGGRKRVGGGATGVVDDDTSSSSSYKRRRQDNWMSSQAAVVVEGVVRQLLDRKPHSVKELIARLKSHPTGPFGGALDKSEMVTRLADIIKKIGPYQFKQKVEDKEVLFFSMNRNA